MQPAETLEFLVAKRLDAVTETIDASARGKPARRSGVTVSGFASIVISASAATVKPSRQASMIDAISAGSSRDGVPPPK